MDSVWLLTFAIGCWSRNLPPTGWVLRLEHDYIFGDTRYPYQGEWCWTHQQAVMWTSFRMPQVQCNVHRPWKEVPCTTGTA